MEGIRSLPAHLGEVDLLTTEHAFPGSLHTPGLGLRREYTEAWCHPLLATKSPRPQAPGLVQPPVGLTNGCRPVPSPTAWEGSAQTSGTASPGMPVRT